MMRSRSPGVVAPSHHSEKKSPLSPFLESHAVQPSCFPPFLSAEPGARANAHGPSVFAPYLHARLHVRARRERGSALTFGLYLRGKSAMRPSVLSAKESSGPTAVFAPTDCGLRPLQPRKAKTPASHSPGKARRRHPRRPRPAQSPNQSPEPTRLSGVVLSYGPSPRTPTFSVAKTAYTLDGARLISNVRPIFERKERDATARPQSKGK
jgi:hypothetical protein